MVPKKQGGVVIFLENSKNFVIFTKSSTNFGEFLIFLGFSNIFLDFQLFFYFFLIFSPFLEHSRKIKKIQKVYENTRKCRKILENPRKLKNSSNLLVLFVKITKSLKFSKKITIKTIVFSNSAWNIVIDSRNGFIAHKLEVGFAHLHNLLFGNARTAF